MLLTVTLRVNLTHLSVLNAVKQAELPTLGKAIVVAKLAKQLS